MGAHPAHRRSVRVTTESAWASLFAHNLFIRPSAAERSAFQADFTIYDAPTLTAEPERDGTRTGTFILVHLTRREVLIGGTAYAGEIKKSAFTVMNYLLPDEHVLPMHSAVNVGPAGDTAVFFGLSGTGKTTLVADPARTLIGDDEHGWGPDGVFNFEGGCYAKTIRLSPIYEPDIFSTTRRFGTILENVVMDDATRELDLDSEALTENTRGAFPVSFISNASEVGRAGHPQHDHLPDRRRLRGPAAHLAADARAGDVPLRERLHGQAGRHGGGGQGAVGHLLGLLRGARSCRAIRASTRRCWATASASTTRPSGSSTPAGPAVRTAPASA